MLERERTSKDVALDKVRARITSISCFSFFDFSFPSSSSSSFLYSLFTVTPIIVRDFRNGALDSMKVKREGVGVQLSKEREVREVKVIVRDERMVGDNGES